MLHRPVNIGLQGDPVYFLQTALVAFLKIHQVFAQAAHHVTAHGYGCVIDFG